MPCSAIRGFRPPRFALPAAPPIWMAKPISQYASRPQPYTKKFIMYVWFAFFTRVSPDSTMAKPACMNMRSEEHTSELQSQSNLVCRLLLEKKKTRNAHNRATSKLRSNAAHSLPLQLAGVYSYYLEARRNLGEDTHGHFYSTIAYPHLQGLG